MRKIYLKFPGACDTCERTLDRGDTAWHVSRGVIRCEDCENGQTRPVSAGFVVFFDPHNTIQSFTVDSATLGALYRVIRDAGFLPHQRAADCQTLAAVEQPAVEQPAVEQPAVKQPAVKQPAVEQPAVEQPAVEQPAVEQPAPVVEQPAAAHAQPVATPVNDSMARMIALMQQYS